MSSPLSGFTAVPNPQMLAFMPIQSYLMMYFAGGGWQIGKRKISAIPNEQFNKMSANDLLKGFTADLRETIPTLERSLQDITPLIKILIEQYGDFIREAIAATPQAIQNAIAPNSLAGVIINAPEGKSDKDILADVLKMLTTFGTIPTAEARLSQGSQEAQRDRLETGLSQQEQERRAKQLVDANERIRQFKIQAESDRLRQIQLDASPKIATVHQTAIQAAREPVGTKRPAGQTQILERTRLVKLLGQISLEIRKWNTPQSKSGISAFAYQKHKKKLQDEFNRTQTLLTGLLQRYRF